MAKGNSIVLGNDPRGRFVEGTLTGALKPGVMVQIDVSEGLDANGRPTFEAFTAADGVRQIVGILVPNNPGQLSTDAYATGERCKVYFPLPGDEINVLLQDVAGTGDAHAFGEILIADSGTGEFIATTGTPEAEPFQLLETVSAPTADVLAHAIFTGY